MSSLAVPRVNPDRCPVHESPARMSTYRHARRVLRPNRIKETSRSSHERGHAYTQMSWSRCCHVAAGCALSMRWQSHKGSAVAADQPCLTHAPTYPTFLLPFIPICLTQPVTATAPVLACMTWSVQNALPVVILGMGGGISSQRQR